MVDANSTGTGVGNANDGSNNFMERGWYRRKKKRDQIRSQSINLVKKGRVKITPCRVCGARENLTIHHIPPMKADRFIFLCSDCHRLFNTPCPVLPHPPAGQKFREFPHAGQFYAQPEAVRPVKAVDV